MGDISTEQLAVTLSLDIDKTVAPGNVGCSAPASVMDHGGGGASRVRGKARTALAELTGSPNES